MDKDLEIVLCGDFLQLPPVNAQYAFEAKCWPKFEENMLKLDKVWRQDNLTFLEALNEFRAGNGRGGVDLLKSCGVRFNDKITRFQGTTILPKNDLVDTYNRVQFADINAPIIKVPTVRTGKQTSDWKKIPEFLELKVGALVMILANDSKYKTYANGDQGMVVSYDNKTQEFLISILSSNSERNNKIVRVPYVHRDHKELINGVREITGTIEYMPLRLAYSSTVHKSQGLTLDKVQIDFRDRFFGNPGSMYVALSRCKTPEGLRLVGSEDMMIKRTVLNEKVRRFL
jgi:ATP-dependent exoDNAse (exonuclease V) alpha subunit